MPYIRFLIVSLVWGSSFVLMKKGTVWLSPTAVGAWRVIGGAALLALVWRRAGAPRGLRRGDIPAVAFVVVFGFAWPFSIQPYLVQYDGSAFIGMMVSFTPLMTIAVSIPLLRVYPTRQQVVGVLGAIVFMGMLLLEGHRRQVPAAHLVLALSVPLCYALTNTLIRKTLAHVTSLEVSLVSLTNAGLLLLPLSLALPASRPPASNDEVLVALGAVAFLGIIGTGVATYLFTRLIQEQGPLFAGMVTNLVPIGAVILAWLDGESITRHQLIALAGLVCMVGIVQYGAAASAIQQPPD